MELEVSACGSTLRGYYYARWLALQSGIMRHPPLGDTRATHGRGRGTVSSTVRAAGWLR